MIIAGTGHRPDKLGGYDWKVADRLFDVALTGLERLKPTKLISGMALGWDQAVARAAVALNIPFIAAIPFVGQEKKWPESSQITFRLLYGLAAEVVIVCDGGYAGWKMQKRNEWMVDHCDHVLALWNGSSGGTENCIKYAEAKGRPITNLWEHWK
jgi:uncharacterized phage-like protein YoqJ